MEPNVAQLTIEEAHRICGGLFFDFKLLEKDIAGAIQEIQRLAQENESLKGEIISLQKKLKGGTPNGICGEGISS